MKTLICSFSLFLGAVTLTQDAHASCNRDQRAMFDCRESFMPSRKNGIGRCFGGKAYKGTVCQGQVPATENGEVGKMCVACWDKTLSRSTKLDNSGRHIGRNLSAEEAERESQRHSSGAVGQ